MSNLSFVNFPETALKMRVSKELYPELEALINNLTMIELLSFCKSKPKYFNGIRLTKESAPLLRKKLREVIAQGIEYTTKTREALLRKSEFGALCLALRQEEILANLQYSSNYFGFGNVLVCLQLMATVPENVLDELYAVYMSKTRIFPEGYAQILKYLSTKSRVEFEKMSSLEQFRFCYQSTLYAAKRIVDLEDTDVETRNASSDQKVLDSTAAESKQITRMEVQIRKILVQKEAAEKKTERNESRLLETIRDNTELKKRLTRYQSQIQSRDTEIQMIAKELENHEKLHQELRKCREKLDMIRKSLEYQISDLCRSESRQISDKTTIISEVFESWDKFKKSRKELVEFANRKRLIQSAEVAQDEIDELIRNVPELRQDLKRFLEQFQSLSQRLKNPYPGMTSRESKETLKFLDVFQTCRDLKTFNKHVSMVNHLSGGDFFSPAELQDIILESYNAWLRSHYLDAESLETVRSFHELSPMTLFLDGYNVILGFKRLFNRDPNRDSKLHELRKEFLKMVLEFAEQAKQVKICIIFDSKTQHGDEQLAENVEIEYVAGSASNKADERILNRAKMCKKTGRVLVFSDDRYITEESRKAHIMTAPGNIFCARLISE